MLRPRSHNEGLAEIRTRFANYGPSGLDIAAGQENQLASELVLAVQRNDAPGFKKTVAGALKCGLKVDDFPIGSLWTDIASIVGFSSHSASSFELPRVREPHLRVEQGATVTAFDDGKNSTSIRLLGGRNLTASRLSAELEVTAGDGTSASSVLPARGISVDGSGRVVALEFPSLKAWGLKDPKALILRLVCLECGSPRAICGQCATPARRQEGVVGGGLLATPPGPSVPVADLPPGLGEAEGMRPGGGVGDAVILSTEKKVAILESFRGVQQEAAGAKPDGSPADAQGSLYSVCDRDESASFRASLLLLQEEQKTPAPNGLKLSVTTKAIVVSETGTGSVDLRIDFASAPDMTCKVAQVLVEGGDFHLLATDLDPASSVISSREATFKGSVSARLRLSNLVPGRALTARAKCKEGDAKVQGQATAAQSFDLVQLSSRRGQGAEAGH